MSDFQKMRLGALYDNYGAEPPDTFEIYADFTQRRGCLPDEILWVRPGLCVAGPVREERSTVLEQREAAPLVGEQARLL